jgi:Tfp pilus assembly protein PilF
MPDETSSPTPDQLWEKAAAYLESGETDGAQKCLLHWALLLDAATKKEWLDRLPPELFNAVSCIVQTAETVSANPNDTALAWVSIGQVWLDRDQPEWAHSCFEKATDTGPNIAMAHHQLGLSWLKKGDVGQAQKSFQQAAKLNPGDAGTWHNLGKCHQEARQNERAVEAYETALAIEPDHPLAGVALASIRLDEFDLAEANVRLSGVIGHHPDNAAARHNRS